jgi:hypothetical protein
MHGSAGARFGARKFCHENVFRLVTSLTIIYLDRIEGSHRSHNANPVSSSS